MIRPKRRAGSSRWLGFLGAVFLGMLVMALVPHGRLQLPSSILSGHADNRASTHAIPLIQNIHDIDTRHWSVFHNVKGEYELRYPDTYGLARQTDGSIVLQPYEPLGSDAAVTIRIENITSTPQKEVLPSMELAGWKMMERQLYALSSPLFSDNGKQFWSEYLFFHDFPLKGSTATLAMVRATIHIGARNAEFQAIHSSGLDPETVLNTPEQILATFHFVSQNKSIDG